jgi:hypothetical protein
MRRFAYAVALTGLLFLPRATQADFLITIGDANIQPGGAGFVDVLIRGTSPGGDPLSAFGVALQITGPGPTRLSFVSPQPDGELTDPRYVFFGNSAAQALGVPVGVVTTGAVPGDTFVGGDSTFPPSEATVSGDGLLLRLEVTADTALPPVVGDTFTVSLLGGPGTFFESSPGTLASYASTPGTVVVANTAAVPAPGTLVLAGVGSLSRLR